MAFPVPLCVSHVKQIKNKQKLFLRAAPSTVLALPAAAASQFNTVWGLSVERAINHTHTVSHRTVPKESISKVSVIPAVAYLIANHTTKANGAPLDHNSRTDLAAHFECSFHQILFLVACKKQNKKLSFHSDRAWK